MGLTASLLQEAEEAPAAEIKEEEPDISHIVNWEPIVFETGNVTPETAAEELARFRLRAGGDMSLDYRDGYRAWRLGRATGATETSGGMLGCHPTARREATMDHADSSSHLYPSLAPAERNTTRYWWRYTVAYWVSTTFLIGSVLFVVGSAFDYFGDQFGERNRVRTSATVSWPYFIGGVCFVAGSYLGYFEAINLGRREDAPPRYWLNVSWSFFWTTKDRTPLLEAKLVDVVDEAWHSFFGYFAYLIGAFFFQVGIVAQILDERRVVHASAEWTALPATLGGFCFVVGAVFAVDVNESWRPSRFIDDAASWIANFNMVGSLLFLLAGVCSFDGLHVASPAVLVQLPYLVGSSCFLCASTMELFMWRVELHGLGFVRAINKTTRLLDLVREEDLADNSSISLNQLCFVIVVILTYAFSLMDLVFAARLPSCQRGLFYVEAYDIYDSALQSLFCFAALALASVVHTIPRQRPFGMLTWILRVFMFLLLIRYSWKFVNGWRQASLPCPPPHGGGPD